MASSHSRSNGADRCGYNAPPGILSFRTPRGRGSDFQLSLSRWRCEDSAAQLDPIRALNLMSIRRHRLSSPLRGLVLILRSEAPGGLPTSLRLSTRILSSKKQWSDVTSRQKSLLHKHHKDTLFSQELAEVRGLIRKALYLEP